MSYRRLEDIKALVLDTLKNRPMTFEELRSKLNINSFFLRLAVAELLREGAIKKRPSSVHKKFLLYV